MKQKKAAVGEARRPKVFENGSTHGSVVSTSTGSYDTTEDLTDTDTSTHIRRNRKENDNGRVRFMMKSNKLHNVESHNDFSSKERSHYWWSDREKDRMMAKHERLVAKYEQQRSGTRPGNAKKLSADKLASYRGLESWTAAGSLKLDHTIEQCISAVMDEQDRQWNENDDDADVIAEKSFVVTEDSARRARLNGLQDAQEALRIRGENWSKKSASDEISVSSALSTGTAAIAKKKKRSKLLARLDDSHKILKNDSSSQEDDVLVALKKEKKSKKSKKPKKSKKSKKSKSRDKDTETTKKHKESDDGDTTDTKTTQPNTVASHIEAHVKAPVNNVTVPVSPLATPDTETSGEVYPLLAALRQEQEKLKQSSGRSQDNALRSIYDREPALDDDDDDSNGSNDIVKLLRDQQRKQSSKWSNHERDDPGDGGNLGIPARSGAPVSKLSSLREDCASPYSEQTPMSDPPGRRPRRLASRHGAPENVSPRPQEKKKTRKKNPSKKSPPIMPVESPSVDDGSRSRSNRDGSARKSLDMLRNGAKSFFKKGAKV